MSWLDTKPTASPSWHSEGGKWWTSRECCEYNRHWKALALILRREIEGGASRINVYISRKRGFQKHWPYICGSNVREELGDMGTKYTGYCDEESVIGGCVVTFQSLLNGENESHIRSGGLLIVDEFGVEASRWKVRNEASGGGAFASREGGAS